MQQHAFVQGLGKYLVASPQKQRGLVKRLHLTEDVQDFLVVKWRGEKKLYLPVDDHQEPGTGIVLAKQHLTTRRIYFAGTNANFCHLFGGQPLEQGGRARSMYLLTRTLADNSFNASS